MPRLKLSDRITWAVLGWIFFNLLWLKFLDALVPLWVGTITATAAAVLFVIFWPRPQEELEEEEPDAANQKQEGK
ncbi:MAG: hypothetical protein A2064_07390 [Spirochaetes bacterium GWB1_66_5]|nr:MAG: hypothetical protein A2064_07390 [Spirochaetes bacterium GWB1_66_5]